MSSYSKQALTRSTPSTPTEDTVKLPFANVRPGRDTDPNTKHVYPFASITVPNPKNGEERPNGWRLDPQWYEEFGAKLKAVQVEALRIQNNILAGVQARKAGKTPDYSMLEEGIFHVQEGDGKNPLVCVVVSNPDKDPPKWRVSVLCRTTKYHPDGDRNFDLRLDPRVIDQLLLDMETVLPSLVEEQRVILDEMRLRREAAQRQASAIQKQVDGRTVYLRATPTGTAQVRGGVERKK